jgi:ATP-dependent DNA ligase
MERLPRVEITLKALKALQIETAIIGGSQKDTLEHLIIKGVSSRTQSALEEVEHVLQEGEKTQQLSPAKHTPPMECQKVGEAIICTARTMNPEDRKALELIKKAFQAGQEPTVNEIADKVGLTPRALGVALSNLGIKAKNTRRASKTVRIYIQPMLPQIEALLASK